MKMLWILVSLLSSTGLSSATEPLKIGVVGLSHSHVLLLLRDKEQTDVEIVGIYETDRDLVDRYAARFGIDTNLVFQSLEEMLDQTKPEGVVTFTSIYDHLKVVEACAPRGIDVMVEKPLAVSAEHAEKMIDLSRKHETLLLTNYETSWYPSNHEGYEMVERGELGELRKVIVYDGHTGPKEIRVNEEFLDWLTDPVLNGGGAVTDFGCYGADLITWLMKGERPLSVYASLKQYKPDVYPKVDDDATIVLSYPTMEGVIHASWNWPFSRKDMHLYGTTGYALLDDKETIRYRLEKKSPELKKTVPSEKAPFKNPFAYFAATVRGDIQVEPTDLSAPELNLTVVKILDAAKESHRTGKQVLMKD